MEKLWPVISLVNSLPGLVVFLVHCQHSVGIILDVDGPLFQGDALSLDALDEHPHPLLLQVVLGQLDEHLRHARFQASLTNNLEWKEMELIC